MLYCGIGFEDNREYTMTNVVLFTGDNECEIAAMLLRQCTDEWIAHALFDAAEFTLGRVYYVDEDVV